ncbi:putative alpha/beta hydrolase [Aspergillus steynii IBT 23096]|uniref:Putative alpha/beta hydrolase n=1 Tax=Aspergillus steynii IBT 23096 TaxID=1392250 RepID=A0A2I2GL44_9EURO|nr:putative alpha/beta hydrolase [Aspergillus steynii IBT 23096]PLB53600.1 putative alpha/beta hydrolase [Aspergillus steynii IBT 23096]
MEPPESLVDIGSHRLFLSLQGTPRALGSPLVVFLAGAGDVCVSFGAVARVVGQFAPTMLYDRSGLGRSQDGPDPPRATTAARELRRLQERAGLEPPFLLVAHSYGGIVAREYLERYPDAVAGLVLVDAATEQQVELIDDEHRQAINAVMGDVNFARVIGLRDGARLSRDEWRTRAAGIARGLSTWQEEAAAVHEICETLGRKDQYRRHILGMKPLAVVRARSSLDYERIYAAGVAAGHGTDAQRTTFRQLLDRWDSVDGAMQKAQLQLSSTHRFIDVPDCGHHVHLIRPELVATQVQWVLDGILSSNQPLEKL